ncbi:signal peptidase I [Verrucomicrobiota bacterium]
MGFLRNRRIRKAAEDVLRQARHLRNMRGDLLAGKDLEKLGRHEAEIVRLRGQGEWDGVRAATQDLYSCVAGLCPKQPFAAARENLEILVVAVSVAMAFRTYFIQPFKIPTGSMQPTLYGITSYDDATPGWTDRMPVKLVKWFVTGEWYRVVKVKASGYLSPPQDAGPLYPADHYYVIAGKRYRIPRNARKNYGPGQFVPKGAVLWAGSRIAGDHVFVNRVSWNFISPRRGDVIVFSTQDVGGLPQGTHYIKRLVGMPGEKMSIAPPDVMADGERIRDTESIRRIADREDGYAGYQFVDPRRAGPGEGILRRPGDVLQLGERDYFALGDNTTNSRDGRYWGSVPQVNMVGPAFLVYWPFSRRWGSIR